MSSFLSKSCQANSEHTDVPELTGVLEITEQLLIRTEELKLVNSAWGRVVRQEVIIRGVFQLILHLKCFMSKLRGVSVLILTVSTPAAQCQIPHIQVHETFPKMK